MSTRFVYQVVFCESRVGRCFRREISVTGSDMMITHVEQMPPGYHIALERMRRDNEEIERLDAGGGIRTWSGYKGCPFCGNRTIFECNCGVLSCRNRDQRFHTCPHCQRIFEPVPVTVTPTSASGLVHGGRQISGRKPQAPLAPQPPQPSDPPGPKFTYDIVGEWSQRLLTGRSDLPRLALPGGKPRGLLGPAPDNPAPDDPAPETPEDRDRMRRFLKGWKE